VIEKKYWKIVGISSAIDFTSRLLENLNAWEYKNYINNKGIEVNSNYSNKPYFFSNKFINNSRKFLLLQKKIKIKCKATLLYGLKDIAVNLETQIQLLNILSHSETTLIISKNSDHRMSSNYDLKILKDALLSML